MMNKKELGTLIAKTMRLTNTEGEDMVDTVFDAIATVMANGEDVSIYGFGQFLVKKKAERMGRNPQTGEDIVIPAKLVPKFKPSKTLKDAVANGVVTE